MTKGKLKTIKTEVNKLTLAEKKLIEQGKIMEDEQQKQRMQDVLLKLEDLVEKEREERGEKEAIEQKKRIEEERMQDVLLMLEHLVEREEATVKIILDCLYDVGSVNLINNKFNSRSLNGMMKYIAKMSKPVFRVVALRWFKKNCPKLIADWLYDQVKF